MPNKLLEFQSVQLTEKEAICRVLRELIASMESELKQFSIDENEVKKKPYIPPKAEIYIKKGSDNMGKWISMKEERPLAYEWVLAYFADGTFMVVATFSNGKTGLEELHGQVTHWQYLPPIPEKSEVCSE